ncbi:unnamed protein product [Sympodiomycopsis kandeliae]
MTPQPIPVCVVGYGSSARTFHIPFINSLPDHFTLHSIQQRPGSKSGPPASEAHPNAVVIPSFEEVLTTLPKPGLIVISTSNSTHFPFAKQALEAGYHVIVEKPITWRVQEAEELVTLSQSKGLVCASFNNRRWDCDYLTVKSLLNSTSPEQPSAIGTPVYFESRFDRFRPLTKGGWREETGYEEGGGLLLDLGSHLVDQLLSLFGPPKTITAFVRNQRGQLAPKVDDDFLIIAQYPPTAPLPPSEPAPGTKLGGLQAVLGATCLSTHVDAEQPRFRVQGVRGSYEKRGTDPQENQLKVGWSPSSHPDSFGIYKEDESSSIRLGRLTTSIDSGIEASATENKQPVQPKLATSDIPTLPGRYIDYYMNVGEAIRAASNAEQGSGSVQAAQQAIDQVLIVKPQQAADCIRFLNLARQSSIEGRAVEW